MWTSSKRGGVNRNPLGDGKIVVKGAIERSNVLKKIKVEGNVSEEQGRKMGRIRSSHGVMDKGLRTDLTEEVK